MEIVITGEWDGQLIWREKTAEDKLCEALWEEEQKKHE